MKYLFIVSRLLFSALILHSCTPKKIEPSYYEKAIIGKWLFLNYKVNGANWNDSAKIYNFNKYIEFSVSYDKYQSKIESRYCGIGGDLPFESDSSCLSGGSWSIINKDTIEFHVGFLKTDDAFPSVTCTLNDTVFASILPVLYFNRSYWDWKIKNDTLNLSTLENGNFYEWILKK